MTCAVISSNAAYTVSQVTFCHLVRVLNYYKVYGGTGFMHHQHKERILGEF